MQGHVNEQRMSSTLKELASMVNRIKCLRECLAYMVKQSLGAIAWFFVSLPQYLRGILILL
jgi:hypothetical protein